MTRVHQDHIQTLVNEGKSVRQIASLLSIGKSTVARYAKAATGLMNPRSKGGRKKCLSACQAHSLITGLLRCQYTLATEASRYWLSIHKVKVSRQTVSRILRCFNFKLRVKKKKPFLNRRHRRWRLAFALMYRSWTVEDWKRFIWSNESKVQRLNWTAERLYWSRRVDYNQNTPTLQGGSHSFMIWGCMTWAGLGLLHFIESRLNSEAYIELLEENLPGSLVKWQHQGDPVDRRSIIFQHDNALCHASAATR